MRTLSRKSDSQSIQPAIACLTRSGHELDTSGVTDMLLGWDDDVHRGLRRRHSLANASPSMRLLMLCNQRRYALILSCTNVVINYGCTENNHIVFKHAISITEILFLRNRSLQRIKATITIYNWSPFFI